MLARRIHRGALYSELNARAYVQAHRRQGGVMPRGFLEDEIS